MFSMQAGLIARLPVVALLAALALAGCAASAPTLGPATTAQLPSQRGAIARDVETGALPAAAETPAGPARREPVKIALLLPLGASGQTASIADALRKAGELALFEQNAAGVQLLVRDDKGTPDGARIAAEEAVKAGVELVIGPLFSKSVAAAAPVIRAARRPMIAFSTDRQVAAGDIMLLSHPVEGDVQRIISYAGAQGKKRIVALVTDDAFGKLASVSLAEVARQSGVTVVATETYAPTMGAMLEALQKVSALIANAAGEGLPVDALFLPGGEDTLAAMSPLLKQANIDTAQIKILGTGGLDYPHASRNPQLAGAWFPGPDPRGWRDFSEKYAKAYGSAPPRIASLAFDAVTIAVALSGGPDGARYSAATLARASGFTGVDGLVRFRADGTPERALAVLEVRDFGPSVIDQATGLGTAPAQVSAQAGPPVARPNGLVN